MPSGISNNRTKWFVNRTAQGRVMWHVGMYWVIYHLFLFHALFLAEGIRGSNATTFRARYASFLSEHVMLVACAVAILPIVLLDMLKLTHRIVGPFARFERALNEMSRGRQVRKLVLRKKDLDNGFGKVFNAFVEYHNREIESRTASMEPIERHASAQVD